MDKIEILKEKRIGWFVFRAIKFENGLCFLYVYYEDKTVLRYHNNNSLDILQAFDNVFNYLYEKHYSFKELLDGIKSDRFGVINGWYKKV